MNSVVTMLSDTSVMSSSCLEISESSRSNGPSKLPRLTENTAASGTPATSDSADAPDSTDTSGWLCSVAVTALGDGATHDQLSGELTVRLGGGMLRSELGDRGSCDGCVGKLHGAADHRFEHAVAEGLNHALQDFPRVESAGVVHGGEDAVELQHRVQPFGDLVDGLHEKCNTA